MVTPGAPALSVKGQCFSVCLTPHTAVWGMATFTLWQGTLEHPFLVTAVFSGVQLNSTLLNGTVYGFKTGSPNRLPEAAFTWLWVTHVHRGTGRETVSLLSKWKQINVWSYGSSYSALLAPYPWSQTTAWLHCVISCCYGKDAGRDLFLKDCLGFHH